MIAFWFCVLLLISVPALAADATVVDGDGLDFATERVRLWGIDAPEHDQTCVLAQAPYPCGRIAAKALSDLVRGKDVRCAKVDIDRYGRTVARCFVDGQDLGAEMVRRGLALDYRRFSGGFYSAAEAAARRERRGLWASTFERPSDWRRKHPRGKAGARPNPPI